MTVVLDTNHFTELVRQSSPGERLLSRLRHHRAAAFTTVVNALEITEGWCALINRLPAGTPQLDAYRQFKNSLQLLIELSLLDFDAESAIASTSFRPAASASAPWTSKSPASVSLTIFCCSAGISEISRKSPASASRIGPTDRPRSLHLPPGTPESAAAVPWDCQSFSNWPQELNNWRGGYRLGCAG